MAILEAKVEAETTVTSVVKTDVDQLRAKIPTLEEGNLSFLKMRDEFLAIEEKMKNRILEYEAKLSALAGEVIRLKNLKEDDQTDSNGSKRTEERKDRAILKTEGKNVIKLDFKFSINLNDFFRFSANKDIFIVGRRFVLYILLVLVR